MSRDLGTAPTLISARETASLGGGTTAWDVGIGFVLGLPWRAGAPWPAPGAGMAGEAGEDRGAVRARRQLRPAGAAARARACGRLRPAVLSSRTAAARRAPSAPPRSRKSAPDGYTLVNAGSGPAPDRPGDQSQYRLRPAQGFHPHRHGGGRQFRAGRQSGAGREVDRRPRSGSAAAGTSPRRRRARARSAI